MRPIFTSIALIVFALWGWSGELTAQTTLVPSSDFSGAWKMDKTRSESAAQDQPIGNVTVVITQTESALKVETIRDGAKEIAVYPIEMRPSTPSEVSGTRRAFWDGSVLVNEGSVEVDGQTIGYRQARTPALDGAEMVVETTLKIEHGYEAKGAQTIVTGKDVFVRVR